MISLVRNGLTVHDGKDTTVGELSPLPRYFELLVHVKHKGTFKMEEIKDKKNILSICCVPGQKKSGKYITSVSKNRLHI